MPPHIPADPRPLEAFRGELEHRRSADLILNIAASEDARLAEKVAAEMRLVTPPAEE